MSVIDDYWTTADARDWAAFGALLCDDVVYELPQTRERIRGRTAYLQFNVEYPGDWHLVVERSVVDAAGGASWATCTVGDESMPAVTFFRFDDAGRIAHIIDFWPTPYEPPPGREHLVERY